MKKGIDYIGVAVCFMCHDGNGKFLFTKRGAKARDEQGKWEVPAGGIEHGETIVEALHRELKEELTVSPRTVVPIGHEEFIRSIDGAVRHWVTFTFLVEVDPAEVAIGEPEMCDGIEWRTLDDLPSPLHPATDDSIGLVRKYLASPTG